MEVCSLIPLKTLNTIFGVVVFLSVENNNEYRLPVKVPHVLEFFTISSELYV